MLCSSLCIMISRCVPRKQLAIGATCSGAYKKHFDGIVVSPCWQRSSRGQTSRTIKPPVECWPIGVEPASVVSSELQRCTNVAHTRCDKMCAYSSRAQNEMLSLRRTCTFPRSICRIGTQAWSRLVRVDRAHAEHWKKPHACGDDASSCESVQTKDDGQET